MMGWCPHVGKRAMTHYSTFILAAWVTSFLLNAGLTRRAGANDSKAPLPIPEAISRVELIPIAKTPYR